MNSWGDAITLGVTSGVLVVWATYIIVMFVEEEIAVRRGIKAAKRRAELCDKISQIHKEWEAEREWDESLKRVLREQYEKQDEAKRKSLKPKTKKRRGK